MGVMEFLYHSDTVIIASDLETLADGLLADILISGVEGYLRLWNHPQHASSGRRRSEFD